MGNTRRWGWRERLRCPAHPTTPSSFLFSVQYLDDFTSVKQVWQDSNMLTCKTLKLLYGVLEIIFWLEYIFFCYCLFFLIFTFFHIISNSRQHDQSSVKGLTTVTTRVHLIVVPFALFQDVSSHCGINCMPTFHFYKNGQKVDEFSGANLQTLITKVESLRS